MEQWGPCLNAPPGCKTPGEKAAPPSALRHAASAAVLPRSEGDGLHAAVQWWPEPKRQQATKCVQAMRMHWVNWLWECKTNNTPRYQYGIEHVTPRARVDLAASVIQPRI